MLLSFLVVGMSLYFSTNVPFFAYFGFVFFNLDGVLSYGLFWLVGLSKKLNPSCFQWANEPTIIRRDAIPNIHLQDAYSLCTTQQNVMVKYNIQTKLLFIFFFKF